MEQLKFLPEEYRNDTLSLLQRVIKVAQTTRLDAKDIIEKLDYIEEKLAENPNYFVNK